VVDLDVPIRAGAAMNVTNPKLTAVEPTAWAPFPGISLLYDDAGCSSSQGLQSLERLAVVTARDDELYRRLHDAVQEAGLRDGVELSLLPVDSYHVTLCDAVNHGNRGQVRGPYRHLVDDTLGDLPDALLRANELMALMRDPELPWSVQRDPARFRVDGLEVRGHALVARLTPSNQRSIAAVSCHEAARELFANRLHTRLGIDVQPWRPHVTLGYLANDDLAARLRDRFLDRWQSETLERTDGASARFVSASVYGFTDMASFWRLAA
jgi:hypothetical protein